MSLEPKKLSHRSAKWRKAQTDERRWRAQAAAVGCEHIAFHQTELCAYPYCLMEREYDKKEYGQEYKSIKTPNCMLSRTRGYCIVAQRLTDKVRLYPYSNPGEKITELCITQKEFRCLARVHPQVLKSRRFCGLPLIVDIWEVQGESK